MGNMNREQEKAMFAKIHASPKLTSNLVDLSKSIDSLEKNRFNGTSAFWKEKIIEFDRITMLIKEQKLDKIQSTVVPEPEPVSHTDFIVKRLNLTLPEDEKNFPFRNVNIRITEIKDNGVVQFDITSNTGDDGSAKRAGEKAGFKFIKQEDILDTRRLTFEGIPRFGLVKGQFIKEFE